MKEVFLILFGVLFISVFVWFFLCSKMFKTLALKHPEKYEVMGKPNLIMNNSLSNNISFMKFLFKREWRDLNDKSVASLGKIMCVFITLYLALFLVVFISVPLGLAP
jgi:hypothetical protein